MPLRTASRYMQPPEYDCAATIIDLPERVLHENQYAIPRSPHIPPAFDLDTEEHRSKKRKIERACDFCRRRKTKCDGPKMLDNVCTNCAQTGRECTYVETSKPRGPPKAYITALEDRVEKVEALLKRLRPEADFSADLGPPIIRGSWRTDPSEPPLVMKSSESSSSGTHRDLSQTLLPVGPTIPLPRFIYGSQDASSSTAAAVGPMLPKYKRFKRNPGSSNRGDSSEPAQIDSSKSSSGSSFSTSDDDESAVELSLVQGMTHLTLHGLRPTHITSQQPPDGQWRFHGKSSSFKLITTARELKQRHMNEMIASAPVDLSNTAPTAEAPRGFAPRRTKYWESLPWEISFEGADASTTPDFMMKDFPPLDLAHNLIDLYFTRNNSLFPLLHRPTFDKQFREELYKSDLWFAGVCMAMFAVASRWSNDTRVLSDEFPEPPPQTSDGPWALAGWKYVEAALDAHRRRRSLFLPTNLFEVQTFVLIAMYFRGTVGHTESWTLISIGIRKTQDVGAHRRKVYGRKPTVEEELWKRAVWHLIAIDRLGSMLAGRPCCAREEDFDLDLPIEVDDKYWENEDPDLAFQQPEGKPALVTAFVYWAKLSQIEAFALRTLYALRGSRQAPVEDMVTRLNQAMLEWIESIPDHLKWTPNIEDDIFSSQSAMLHLSYYIVQITIYRPFIPSARSITSRRTNREREHSSPEADGIYDSMSALSICVNAAKAGTRILEVFLRRNRPRHTVVIHYLFIYTGVLLVNLWSQIKKEVPREDWQLLCDSSRISPSMLAQTEDLAELVTMLDNMRPRWELARDAYESIKRTLPPFLMLDNEGQQTPSMDPQLPASEEPRVPPRPRYYYPSPGPSSIMAERQLPIPPRAPDLLHPHDHPQSQAHHAWSLREPAPVHYEMHEMYTEEWPIMDRRMPISHDRSGLRYSMAYDNCNAGAGYDISGLGSRESHSASLSTGHLDIDECNVHVKSERTETESLYPEGHAHSGNGHTLPSSSLEASLPFLNVGHLDMWDRTLEWRQHRPPFT